MKQIFLFVTLFLGVTVVTVAQDDGDGNKEGAGRIEALKIAFLTKKLNLSTEEAQKFWPIYNSYIKEVRQTRQEARLNNTSEIDKQEKMLTIRKKYNGEFTKALSTEKVNTFFRAETEFGAFLQKELMERRQQKMDNRKQRIKQ
jgi:hypothetical protein